MFDLNFSACLYVSCRELYVHERVRCYMSCSPVDYRALFVLSESIMYNCLSTACCGVRWSVYLLDPTGVLYRRSIYLVQARIVEGGFIGVPVLSTEPRSMYSFSRFRVVSMAGP